jgi:hypothetical protein
MAAHGKIRPTPDFAIFADTGAEPAAVYEHLAWLRSPNVLPFPVEIVSAGDLRGEILDTATKGTRNDARPPFFVRNADGSTGMLRRQCTGDYKIDPIHKWVRQALGLRPRQHGPKTPVVVQWIGISTDEASRAKPSRHRWIEHRWPLIDAGMSRHDCLRWLERHNYPRPPKSACTFCPYSSDARLRDMRANDPVSWAEAVAVDKALRSPLYRRIVGTAYVHRSLVPLDEVDLSTAEERGQMNMFNDECEGMCGV